MSISREEILHLAELSNLSLSDAEITSLGIDLNRIVDYISQLDELDVSGVNPTYQVFEMNNVWREDIVEPPEIPRETLLSLSSEVEDNQMKVSKVL